MCVPLVVKAARRREPGMADDDDDPMGLLDFNVKSFIASKAKSAEHLADSVAQCSSDLPPNGPCAEESEAERPRALSPELIALISCSTRDLCCN